MLHEFLPTNPIFYSTFEVKIKYTPDGWPSNIASYSQNTHALFMVIEYVDNLNVGLAASWLAIALRSCNFPSTLLSFDWYFSYTHTYIFINIYIYSSSFPESTYKPIQSGPFDSRNLRLAVLTNAVKRIYCFHKKHAEILETVMYCK